jgi:hypothetical protein
MFLDPDYAAPRPGPRIDFWTPLNRQPEPVFICSDRIVAHAIHFDKRTVPCTLLRGANGETITRCELCDRGILPRRWRGYLHVLRPHAQSCVFLCLTPGAGYLLQQTYGLDFCYRGAVARVHRQGGQRNKPLIVEIDAIAPRRTSLPEALDPGPYLDTVFRQRLRLSEGE